MFFYVVNLGCKVNRVETDTFSAELLSRGHKFIDTPVADLVLVNTCTVTGEAEKKTRKAVRHACASYPRATIVVTGCAAAIDPDTYEQIDERVVVVPKRVLLDLVSNGGLERVEGASSAALDKLLDCFSAVAFDDSDCHDCETLSSAEIRAGAPFNTRVGIKVQDGCDNECTYCIVHTARGKAYSRPSRDIINEAKALADAGVKEIVLSGINLGSYGKQKDFSEDMTLAGLLRALLVATESPAVDAKQPPRFRVSSVEPCDIDDDFIQILASSQGRICRHLHLPMQAGSSKVLREMNRPYSAEEFASIVSALRTSVPELSLSTDVIVGFPGETDEEFAETMRMCEACGFSKIHVFPYSMRSGTPAAERNDQVAPQVKSQRAAQLRQLASQLRKRDYSRRFGSVEPVLVESKGKGLTESYYEIEVSDDATRGSLVLCSLPDRYCQ